MNLSRQPPRQLPAPRRHARLVEVRVEPLPFHEHPPAADGGVDHRLGEAEDEVAEDGGVVERGGRVVVDQDEVGGRALGERADREAPQAARQLGVPGEERAGELQKAAARVVLPEVLGPQAHPQLLQHAHGHGVGAQPHRHAGPDERQHVGDAHRVVQVRLRVVGDEGAAPGQRARRRRRPRAPRGRRCSPGPRIPCSTSRATGLLPWRSRFCGHVRGGLGHVDVEARSPSSRPSAAARSRVASERVNAAWRPKRARSCGVLAAGAGPGEGGVLLQALLADAAGRPGPRPRSRGRRAARVRRTARGDAGERPAHRAGAGVVVDQGGGPLPDGVEQGHLGAHLDVVEGELAVEPPPEVLEDLLEVLARRGLPKAADQGGVEVHVGVHEPGQHHLAAGVEDAVPRAPGATRRARSGRCGRPRARGRARPAPGRARPA